MPRSAPSVLLLVVTLSASAVAVAQDAQTLTPIWETAAAVIFPLEDLLNDGRMPVSVKADGGVSLRMIDLATGKALWQVQAPGKVEGTNHVDGVLVVGYADRLVAHRATDGEVLWQQKLEGRLERGTGLPPEFAQSQWFQDVRTGPQGTGGTILSHAGHVYCSIRGTIYCLDPATGGIIWQTKAGFSIYHPLVGVANLVVIATARGIVALDCESGQPVWNSALPMAAPVLCEGEELYAGNTRGLCRLDTGTGETRWQAVIRVTPGLKLQFTETRIVVSGNRSVAVLGRDNGQILGQAQTFCNPALDGDLLLYAPQQAQRIDCISVADMASAWQSPCQCPNPDKILVGGSVAVVLSPLRLCAYSVQDGALLWELAAPAGRLFRTEARAIDDSLVFTRVDKSLVGLDLNSGAETVQVAGEFFSVDWMRALDGCLLVHSGRDEGSLGAIRYRPATAAPTEKEPEEAGLGVSNPERHG